MARKMFFRAVVLLPAISLSLRIRGFQATQQTLQNVSIPSKKEKPDGPRVQDCERVNLAIRMVNAAARYAPGRSTCLEKSLALWWFLRRQEIASSVRVGARKSQGNFEAHAWVECQGVALNEPQQEHRHYAAFDASFPAQRSEIS
jgi:Transglutaminase-like superfamily